MVVHSVITLGPRLTVRGKHILGFPSARLEPWITCILLSWRSELCSSADIFKFQNVDKPDGYHGYVVIAVQLVSHDPNAKLF